MKYFFPILVLCACLVACAGNPPQWWNPGNRYGQTQNTATSSGTSVKKTTDVVTQEESIEPLPDNSYEEEVLAPLPEEEDMPAPVKGEAEPALENGLPVPSVLE